MWSSLSCRLSEPSALMMIKPFPPCALPTPFAFVITFLTALEPGLTSSCAPLASLAAPTSDPLSPRARCAFPFPRLAAPLPLPTPLVAKFGLGDLPVLLLASFHHAFHQTLGKVSRHKQPLQIIQVTLKAQLVSP